LGVRKGLIALVLRYWGTSLKKPFLEAWDQGFILSYLVGKRRNLGFGKLGMVFGGRLRYFKRGWVWITRFGLNTILGEGPLAKQGFWGVFPF